VSIDPLVDSSVEVGVDVGEGVSVDIGVGVPGKTVAVGVGDGVVAASMVTSPIESPLTDSTYVPRLPNRVRR
jgi:hypothetical protein